MLTTDRSPMVTRRTLLSAAAVATTTATLVTEGVGAAAAAPVPRVQVRPIWSEELRRTYGVAVLPSVTVQAYDYVDEWTQRLADLGASHVRGRYNPNSTQTLQMIQRCRALGLKWIMAVVPEDWSMSEQRLKTVLTHVRDHAADVCLAIEGINEPNHNRDGSPVRADWPQLTVNYQRVIKTFLDSTPSMAHVASIGPSLQLSAEDPTPDFFALRDAGLTPFLDYAGMHNYPKGWVPTNLVKERLGWVRDAWGDVPTWFTETGYNTALGTRMSPNGPTPVPQDVAATYGPRSVIDFAKLGCKAVRFQLLDWVNPANNVVLFNYGMIENGGDAPSTWSVKKEYRAMRAFLSSLKDGASSYTPPPVSIGVRGPKNLRWLATGKSDGSKSLLLYRSAPVWNPDTRTRLTVNPADVTITDRLGTRVVKVGAQVVAVPIR